MKLRGLQLLRFNMTTTLGSLVLPCWNKRAHEGRAYLAKGDNSPDSVNEN